MESEQKGKEGQRKNLVQVARALFERGGYGATDDEMEIYLDMRHQTASARRRDLVIAGLVKESGERRKTRSGRTANVWVWCGGAWRGDEFVVDAVATSGSVKRKIKRARGGRHPLDVIGMVRVSREVAGRDNPDAFRWMGYDKAQAVARLLEAKAQHILRSGGMKDQAAFEQDLMEVVYAMLSTAWAHGVNVPEAFNDAHRKAMKRVSDIRSGMGLNEAVQDETLA